MPQPVSPAAIIGATVAEPAKGLAQQAPVLPLPVIPMPATPLLGLPTPVVPAPVLKDRSQTTAPAGRAGGFVVPGLVVPGLVVPGLVAPGLVKDATSPEPLASPALDQRTAPPRTTESDAPPAKTQPRTRENLPFFPAPPPETHTAAILPSPEFASPAAAAQSGRIASSDPAPSPPSVPQQPPADLAPPRPAAQQIAISITRADSPTVDLQVTQRAGDIRVAVHTPDAPLQTALRQDLPTLVNSLERSGYHAELFGTQSHVSAPNLSDFQAGDCQEARSGFTSRDDSQQPRQQPGQQQPQQQRRQAPAQWTETLENAA